MTASKLRLYLSLQVHKSVVPENFDIRRDKIQDSTTSRKDRGGNDSRKVAGTGDRRREKSVDRSTSRKDAGGISDRRAPDTREVRDRRPGGVRPSDHGIHEDLRDRIGLVVSTRTRDGSSR